MAVEEQIQQKLDAVESDYFSKVEAAARLRHDPRTLERWFNLGIGPPAKLISGRRYYNKKKFLQWLVDREREAPRKDQRAPGARRRSR